MIDRWKLGIFSIFVLATMQINALSVVLFNDSPFVLDATIISAIGETMASMTIYPQKRMTWNDSYLGAGQFSKTPYTVIWTCKDGAEFGTNYNIASGGTATPLGSSGRRYCKPEKQHQSPLQNE